MFSFGRDFCLDRLGRDFVCPLATEEVIWNRMEWKTSDGLGGWGRRRIESTEKEEKASVKIDHEINQEG